MTLLIIIAVNYIGQVLINLIFLLFTTHEIINIVFSNKDKAFLLFSLIAFLQSFFFLLFSSFLKGFSVFRVLKSLSFWFLGLEFIFKVLALFYKLISFGKLMALKIAIFNFFYWKLRLISCFNLSINSFFNAFFLDL